MAIPILSAAEIQRIDAWTIKDLGIPGCVLMESAGKAVAETAEGLLGELGEGQVLVLCGKGNNGGDGFVAARHLHNSGHMVVCAIMDEVDSLQGDAAVNAKVARGLGIPMARIAENDDVDGLDWEGTDLIIDALFGTGLSKEVGGLYAELIARARACLAPVLAVDLPSGLSADTGQVLGICLPAHVTVTFGAPKRGHLLQPGSELAGDLHVADIGFPPQAFETQELGLWLLCEHDVADYLQRRPTESHKGRFGHLLVLAGSENQPGAAGLAVRAALRSGAGLVSLAAPGQVLQRVISGPSEAMGVPVEDLPALQAACRGKSALALGPGMGAAKAELVRQAVREIDLPMVIDADGLNALVGNLEILVQVPGKRILSPHPGEAGRLLGSDAATVQADRLGSARRLAELSQAVVVLKGSHSVIADPDGQSFIVPTGNPGMATGGSGDVLTGMLGAFLAEGLGCLEAACVATYCHGLAGDVAALAESQRSLVAGDLIERLPQVYGRFESVGDLPEDQDD